MPLVLASWAVADGLEDDICGPFFGENVELPEASGTPACLEQSSIFETNEMVNTKFC